jgi:hypothetical protein
MRIEGTFAGVVSSGPGALTSAGGTDVFVAKLAPGARGAERR